MSISFRKLISCLAIVCILVSSLALFAFESSASTTIIKTVDLTHIKMNDSGYGYTWDNMNDKLTLNNISLITSDDYGIRLPEGLMEGCTVELIGDNYISAKTCAMTLSGSVTFTGSGTLTLVGGECGMWNYSQMPKHTVRFISGTYNITGGIDAVRSKTASLVFVDGNMNLTGQNDSGFGITGRSIKLVGGNIKSNSSLYASYQLAIDNANVEIDSGKAAVSVGELGTISFDDVKLISGWSKNKSQPVDFYNGDNYLLTDATGFKWGDSVIFGEALPKYVDYIVLFAAVISIGLVIGLPIIHKNKKKKLALERSEEYIAEREAEFKAEKKQRRNSK